MDRKQGLHKCVGLERMAMGMSTDSILEPQFSQKLFECMEIYSETESENGRFILHGDLCPSKFILDGA
jgi:hypothetical protein